MKKVKVHERRRAGGHMTRRRTFESPEPSLVLRLDEGELVSGRAAAGETSQCESQQALSSGGRRRELL